MSTRKQTILEELFKFLNLDFDQYLRLTQEASDDFGPGSSRDPDESDYFIDARSSVLNEQRLEQLEQLEDLLLQFYQLKKQHSEISARTLVNWSELLLMDHQPILTQGELSSTEPRHLRWLAEQGDSNMAWAYLAFNILGLGLCCLGFVPITLSTNLSNALTVVSGSTWSGIDFLGGLLVAINLLDQEEYFQGSLNLLSSLQLLGSTLAANLGTWGVASMSAATISGLMGFSFAACMVVGFGLEMYEIGKCNKRIRSLEQELTAEKDPVKQDVLYKTILIEKAHREQHKRLAASWLAGAAAMTSLAIVSYLVLSGFSFGVVPAATVGVIAFACVTAMIRKWWVNRVDHVANLKLSVSQDTVSELQSLPKTIDGISLVDPIIPRPLKQIISIKEYLEDLLMTHPNDARQNILYLKYQNKAHQPTREFSDILTKIKKSKTDLPDVTQGENGGKPSVS